MNLALLEQLRGQFAIACYRPEIEKYEIGGLVFLSAGAVTAEEVVMERITPPHLRDAGMRRALGGHNSSDGVTF